MSHRDADVRLLQRGRIVHAVPGHRDHLAGGLMARQELQLLLGADAGVERRLLPIRQFAPLHDPRRRVLDDPGHMPDLARGRRRVAGHHDDAHPCRAARGHRLPHFLARRVEQPQQRDHRETPVDFGPLLVLARHGQNTQPLARHRVGAAHPLGTVGSVARVKDRFGRTLHRDDPIVNRRHHPRRGVERLLPSLRMFAQQGGAIDARRLARHEQRDLERIAGTVLGVVAQHPDLERLARLLRNRDDVACCKRDAHQREPVLRERSGLVGEDDRRGAENFHRGEPVDQCVARRHAPHAACERERGDDRKALGNRRDGQRDAELDHQEELLARCDAEQRGEQGDDEGELDELAAQRFQPFLQRRDLLGRFVHQPRDAAQFRRHAGLDYHAFAGATRQGGCFVEDAGAFVNRCVGGDGFDSLGDRKRLPGQCRLVGLQTGRLENTDVRRDDVAALEHDDVTRHERMRGNLAHRSIPAHPHAGSAEAA
jgi:hypothetical protein